MTTRPMSRATRTAVTAPAAVLLLALLVAAVALGPELPARIAQHFDAAGTANGWGSPWPVFGGALATAVVALGVALAVPRFPDRRTAAMVVLVTELLASVLVVTWILLAVVNRSAEPTLPVAATLVIVPVAVVAGAVPLVALWRTAGPVPRRAVAPLAVPPGARVAWRGRAGSRWFAVLGVLLTVIGVVAAVMVGVGADATGTAVVTGGVSVFVGLTVLVLARVEVTVDRRGLRVTSAVTRLPLMRVPLDQVRSCGWEDVSPGQWGGWGYRFSGRGVAYVSRSGPGLVVETVGGGARLVTVDGAAEAAATLGALLEARAA